MKSYLFGHNGKEALNTWLFLTLVTIQSIYNFPALATETSASHGNWLRVSVGHFFLQHVEYASAVLNHTLV